MDNLLIQYANDPKNPYLNFELAKYYKDLKHYAGACTYFLRVAEWGDMNKDKDLIYESLIQTSLCFRELKNRIYSEEGWLLHAISLCPERPEAFWLLSNCYRDQAKWQEDEAISSIGLLNAANAKPLLIDIGYKGEYVLAYNKIQASWYGSKIKESRKELFNLPDKYKLDEEYLVILQKDFNSVGLGVNLETPRYNKEYWNNLRFKFKDSENIEKNYSQIYQDMFVLSMLDGKRDGYYLEIGSGDPIINNNTYLLEKEFNWKGVSIEIQDSLVQSFKNIRNNKVHCVDATKVNYLDFFKENNLPKIIDYLQIDCEPALHSYNILTSIPFNEYKFAVITFEHDYYCDVYRRIKGLSREYLKNKGYVLVVDSLSTEGKFEFEDWWVHPDLIPIDILNKMISVNENVKTAEKYMLFNNVDKE